MTNYENQIVNLARTTLRNIIGTLTKKSANSERGKINEELRSTLLQETASWGIEILRNGPQGDRFRLRTCRRR